MERALSSVPAGVGRRIDEGHCLMDVARAERDLGLDPSASLEPARELLTESGALLRRAETDALLEEIRTA
jgi:hypothetical protein